jgi:hypothetical protein
MATNVWEDSELAESQLETMVLGEPPKIANDFSAISTLDPFLIWWLAVMAIACDAIQFFLLTFNR